jgi:hypothetical protein
MCIYNGNDKAHTLKLSRFSERLAGAKAGRDILSRTEFTLDKELVLNPRSVMVMEVK